MRITSLPIMRPIRITQHANKVKHMGKALCPAFAADVVREHEAPASGNSALVVARGPKISDKLFSNGTAVRETDNSVGSILLFVKTASRATR